MEIKNLKAYLANIDMTLRDFSEIIECSPEHLSRVVKGKTMASPRLAKDIREATSGLINPTSRSRKRNISHQAKQNEEHQAKAI